MIDLTKEEMAEREKFRNKLEKALEGSFLESNKDFIIDLKKDIDMPEKDEIEQYFDGSCKFYLFENGTYLPYLGILTEEQALSILKTVFGHVDLGMMHKADGKQITWFNGTLCAISSDQSDDSAFVSRENLFKDLKNPKIIKHIGE